MMTHEGIGERFLCAAAGMRTFVVTDDEAQRTRIESEMRRAGFLLPVSHCLPWARCATSVRSWFIIVRDDAGSCRGGFALSVTSSRALPRHVVLRAERLGPSLPPAAREVGLLAIARLARDTSRVLRVYAELFDRDGVQRDEFVRAAAAIGFRSARMPRSYARTIAVDLTPSEDAQLRSFSTIVRRNISKVQEGRVPLELRPLTDLALVPRMARLLADVYARTGGDFVVPDLAHPITLSLQAPELSRVVGLFRTDRGGPEALVGFAWGKMQGDCASYDTGAAGRYDGGSIGVAYPLMWDLMRWARSEGASWFDLGGITDGHHGSDDRLGGISDFKRKFGGVALTVGADVEFEPSATRARLAEAVGASARFAARVAGPLRMLARPLRHTGQIA